jgi:hypothetical protein
MARCKHDGGNIQQFTEICLDCGHNIYETDAEYAASLRNEIDALRARKQQHTISRLEEEKETLQRELGDIDDDKNYGGW